MAHAQPRRPGFTLVELLVVILIIAILAAFLTAAARGVLKRATNFGISTDVANLGRAMEAYKEKYGDYPPDFADAKYLPFDQTVAYRHIRKVWQRIAPSELAAIASIAPTIDTAEAIPFWLGGLSANAKAPFSGSGGPLVATGDSSQPWAWRTQDRNEPLYTFEESRLYLEMSGAYVVGVSYLPKGQNTPYTYFNSRTYSFVDSSGKPNYARYVFATPDGSGVTGVVPYKSVNANQSYNPSSVLTDSAVRFVNQDTFQIISAGGDDEFGPVMSSASPFLVFNDQNGNPVPLFTVFPTFGAYHPNPPTPDNYALFNKGQEDNLTNFSEGKTLQDAVP